MRCLFCMGALLAAAMFTVALQGADTKSDAKDSKESASTAYTSVEDVTVVLAGAGKSSVTVKVAGPAKGGNIMKAGRATTQDKEYEFTDGVQIRQMHLPPKLDEKGKPIAYTADEKQKMRGKDGVGYEASASDLKAGQTVRMHMVKLKGAKGEDALKLYVAKIVIMSEPPAEMHDPNDAKKPAKKP